MLQRPIIFAHRGLNTLAPENTLSAFRLAAENGIKWFETDVDILGDGTAIICHDTTLDRTTNKSGTYYELTKDDLPSIDAGSWFSADYKGEAMPTLRDLVRFMNKSGMNANLEIKSNEAGKAMTLRLIDSVIAELEALNPDRKIIISSFNHVLLYIFKQRAPKIPIGCLYETCALYDDWKSVLELVGADYIHPEDSGLTKEKIEAFRRAGFGVNVLTVNDLGRANQLFNWGATGIFTDVAHQIPQPQVS